MKATSIITTLIAATMLAPTTVAYAMPANPFENPYQIKPYEPTEFDKPADDILLDSDEKLYRYLAMVEGYSNVEDYINDLEALRSDADGLYDAIVDLYSGIISDEEKEKVALYTDKMRNCYLISIYESYSTSLDKVVDALEKRKPVISRSYSSSYSDSGSYYPSGGSGVLTKSGGVNYFNGRRETWYSQRVLPGGGLRIPGRHVASDGTIRDADGYVVVAASDLAYGSVVETSLGTGKVYDTGCAAGTTDVYVDW